MRRKIMFMVLIMVSLAVILPAQATSAQQTLRVALVLLNGPLVCFAQFEFSIVHPAILPSTSIPFRLTISIQGNIKASRSLAEPLQVGMDNGARRAMIPVENKRHFLDVSADIMERVDPVFYSDPLTAALKALGLN